LNGKICLEALQKGPVKSLLGRKLCDATSTAEKNATGGHHLGPCPPERKEEGGLERKKKNFRASPTADIGNKCLEVQKGEHQRRRETQGQRSHRTKSIYRVNGPIAVTKIKEEKSNKGKKGGPCRRVHSCYRARERKKQRS